MNALNRLGTVLTVVFSVCLAALVAEILYVLWRRRRFRRRTVTSSVADVDFSSVSPSTTPSKELLYFFSWKSQTARVEPDSITATAATLAPPLPADMTDAEVEEMLKLQGMYGPSRVLYTIKEEEREEMEGTEYDASSMENELVKRETTCLEEVAAIVNNDVVVEVDEEMTTPYWTPCASPQYYYTPSPSPSRDLKSDSPVQGLKMVSF